MGQDGLCSLNELLFLHLLYTILVLVVACLYFLSDTSNPALETKPSTYFMILSLILVTHEHVLLKVGTHLQNPGNPNGARNINLMLQIDRKRGISTHFEHSLGYLALRLPVLFIDRSVSSISRIGLGACHRWKFRPRVPVIQANLSITQGITAHEKFG